MCYDAFKLKHVKDLQCENYYLDLIVSNLLGCFLSLPWFVYVLVFHYLAKECEIFKINSDTVYHHLETFCQGFKN